MFLYCIVSMFKLYTCFHDIFSFVNAYLLFCTFMNVYCGSTLKVVLFEKFFIVPFKKVLFSTFRLPVRVAWDEEYRRKSWKPIMQRKTYDV